MPAGWKFRMLKSEKIDSPRPESLFGLKNKVAVVTGSGGDLGVLLSAGLAGLAGCRAQALLTDYPKTPMVDTAVATRAAGGAVHEFECDLLEDACAIFDCPSRGMAPPREGS
jgi:hypothetical protein